MNDGMVSDRHAAVAPAKALTNRNTRLTRLIAGVSVPDGPLITAAIEYAQRLSEPYLFNHAMRSWLFAELIGRWPASNVSLRRTSLPPRKALLRRDARMD